MILYVHISLFAFVYKCYRIRHYKCNETNVFSFIFSWNEIKFAVSLYFIRFYRQLNFIFVYSGFEDIVVIIFSSIAAFCYLAFDSNLFIFFILICNWKLHSIFPAIVMVCMDYASLWVYTLTHADIIYNCFVLYSFIFRFWMPSHYDQYSYFIQMLLHGSNEILIQ